MKLPPSFLKRIRVFNKHVTNRLTSRIARSAHGPFALVRHVGRRSGKRYETPLIVVPIPDGFVIALTYGSDVDWYRNVIAAGSCEILWHRRDYAIDRIEPLDAQTGLLQFHLPERALLPVLGTQHFVRMSYRANLTPQSPLHNVERGS